MDNMHDVLFVCLGLLGAFWWISNNLGETVRDNIIGVMVMVPILASTGAFIYYMAMSIIN